ncbi:MAG: hypothetical protein V1676_00670 [Candidatus Diapherotrites archaeon]
MAHKTLAWVERIFLFLLAFGLVVYFVIAFNKWAAPLKDVFLFTGDIENFVIITAMLFALTFVLKKLLVWEARATFGRPRKRGRK